MRARKNFMAFTATKNYIGSSVAYNDLNIVLMFEQELALIIVFVMLDFFPF